MKKSVPTVAEIIKKLQELPQELPCYLRSKYTGDVRWCDDHPVNLNGIGEMENTDLGKHVTFLY